METTARRLRDGLGMTQLEVSLATSVHPSLISKLETGDGRPGLRGLIRLARFYGVTVEQLIEESPKPEIGPESEPAPVGTAGE